jgi:hypothetical protein
MGYQTDDPGAQNNKENAGIDNRTHGPRLASSRKKIAVRKIAVKTMVAHCACSLCIELCWVTKI